MHDFVALEGLGIPTMFVVSSEFADAVDAQARALGYAAIPAVYVPHPIQDRTDDEMRALADQAWLTAPVSA
ncbi:hypothetical protein PA7_45020 [Pseudonocardia asaccharolytica DSM 44247 = NBRC 16224]|uniref:UGSC-like domain-containing protein n=1 Tax=Pseudonocardia asaccharolytica DSM 44247 = NBRC 16224 TaxID=1123024 RepID=A0A511D781_9PSEU|nr:hypothetical protein PA7_45020 [Pseudonocardia asaccharolytica DSM 44247 = NBRC 16224]